MANRTGDASVLYHGQSYKYMDYPYKTGLTRQTNSKEYSAAFFDMVNSIDLDDPKTYLPDASAVPEPTMELVRSNVQGTQGDVVQMSTGNLVQKALSVVCSEKTKLRVLFLSRRGRGPVNWIVESLKRRPVDLDLVAVCPDRSWVPAFKGKLQGTGFKFTFFEEDPLLIDFDDRLYDVVYAHGFFHQLLPPDLLSLVRLVAPKGILTGTFPNAAKVSSTTGRIYHGIDGGGCAVSSSFGEVFHDNPPCFGSLMDLDPRITRAPLLSMMGHPFFNYPVPIGQGEHSISDALWFHNVFPPKVVFPKKRDLVGDQLPEPLRGNYYRLKTCIDHPVPANTNSLLSQGSHFLVKEKQDGKPVMLQSSLDGKHSVAYDIELKEFLVLSGNPKKIPANNCFISQWEAVGEEMRFSRPSYVIMSGVVLPYNFQQLLHFAVPVNRINSIFRSTCSGLEDLTVEEGFVLTSPYSMRPNVSKTGIGMSLHVKRKQTIDVKIGKETVEYEIPSDDLFDQDKHFVRTRGDKKPNTAAQIDRLRNSISFRGFIDLAPGLGSVLPAGSQIDLLQASVQEREDLMKMANCRTRNLDTILSKHVQPDKIEVNTALIEVKTKNVLDKNSP